jgi:hypothetical protein
MDVCYLKIRLLTKGGRADVTVSDYSPQASLSFRNLEHMLISAQQQQLRQLRRLQQVSFWPMLLLWGFQVAFLGLT